MELSSKNFDNRKEHISNIIINIDPWVLSASTKEFHQELPVYLYDYDYSNDVNYLLNFSILKEYTIGTIKSNIQNSIPDYNSDSGWDDGTVCGKEKVLEAYRNSSTKDESWDDIFSYEDSIDANIDVLETYITQMQDTHFIFFFSPYSMLYWKDQNTEIQKAGYLYACQRLLSYDNTSVYLWSDNEMLSIMSDLDNYRDFEHYGGHISHMIIDRIGNKQGLLTYNNYEYEINTLFAYIESFDYELLFE